MIEYSYTFTNISNPGFNPKKGDTNGAVHQASIDIKYATLQPFCSSALGYSALVATVTPSTVVTPMATSTVLSTTTTTASINKRAAVISNSASLSTPAVLTKYPASVLSSACSMVVTQATSTSTSTAPLITVQASTQTTLETSVITVTASPIPSACGNKGIQFAYYGQPIYTEGDNVGNVEPSDYATRTPTWEDTTTKVGGIDVEVYSSEQIQIYDTGREVSSQYFVLNHRGYVSCKKDSESGLCSVLTEYQIFAQVAGTYTFTLSNPDDIVFLWLGANAQSGWNRDNAAAYAPLSGYATTTHTLEAGEYLPFRIFFGQQGGPVRFAFSIQAPDGTTILDNSTSESDFIVQYSCDETSAPRYPAFGRE